MNFSLKTALFAATAALAISFKAAAIDVNEDKRVNALLDALSVHHELVFIRNGDEHNVKEAVDHLKMKYDYAKDDLKTAEDFIEHCASRSSFSNKEYMVLYPDGKKETSSVFLTRLLNTIDATRKSTTPA